MKVHYCWKSASQALLDSSCFSWLPLILTVKQFVQETLLYVCNIHPKAVFTLNLTLRRKPKNLGRAQLQALEKSKAVAGPQRIPLKINELGNDLGIGMGKIWCERSQIVLIVRFWRLGLRWNDWQWLRRSGISCWLDCLPHFCAREISGLLTCTADLLTKVPLSELCRFLT